MTDLSSLPSSVFAPLVGQTVVFTRADGVEMTAEVVKVVENPRGTPPDAPRIAFSVILHVAEPCEHTGGSYSMAHPDPEVGELAAMTLSRIANNTLNRDYARFELAFN
ncbi:MAG: DUF6916 family protein [Actinomycetota bacterium]